MIVVFMLEHILEHMLHTLLCATRIEEDTRHGGRLEDDGLFGRGIVGTKDDVRVGAAEAERIDTHIAARKRRLAGDHFECAVLQLLVNVKY